MHINKAIAFRNPDLSVGVRVPTTVERSTDFLIKRVKDYETIRDVDIKETMKLCDKIYQFEGTCGTAIDIFIEFSITPIMAEPTGIDDLDKTLKFFNNQVNAGVTSTMRGIQEVMQKIGLDWFIKGNAFPYNSWENINIPDVSAPQALPNRIVLLNPQYIQIPKETQMLGQAQLYFSPPHELLTMIQQDGRKQPGVKDLKSFNLFKRKNQTNDGFRLNPRFIKHIKRKGNDYNIWGIPYLTKVFSSLASVRRLRRLDDATTDGLISLTTIYKIGSDAFPAKAGRLQAFKSLIQHPTSTQTLVWAHDVEVEQVGPDGTVLAFEKKYSEPRQEMLRALGVPAILIDPSITRGADPYVSIISMAERLDKFRDSMKIWLEDVYRQIAIANGHDDIYPSAKWQRMNLSNDQSIKNLVMQFYDRGLIDAETALEESQYDYDSVIRRKKKNKTKDLTLLPPPLPFGGSIQEKGRPPKGSPKDKSDKPTRSKPAVDQKVGRKPSKPAPKAKAMIKDDDNGSE